MLQQRRCGRQLLEYTTCPSFWSCGGTFPKAGKRIGSSQTIIPARSELLPPRSRYATEPLDRSSCVVDDASTEAVNRGGPSPRCWAGKKPNSATASVKPSCPIPGAKSPSHQESEVADRTPRSGCIAPVKSRQLDGKALTGHVQQCSRRPQQLIERGSGYPPGDRNDLAN
jgi:hypothetical protein